MAFDVGPMLKGLKAVQQRKLAAAIRATDIFAEQALGDAQQLCPVATGALQASGTALPIKVEGTLIDKQIGFNTDYAAAVHENLEASHTVGQAKFLETALREDAPKFGEFLAKAVREAE